VATFYSKNGFCQAITCRVGEPFWNSKQPLPLAYGALHRTTIVIAPSGARFSRLLLSGTLVWRVVTPMYPSGRILQHRGSAKGHPGVSRRLERKSQTFCLDGYGGIDHGKAVALSANVGEDSTRMHFATEQKEKQ
jgi:hypothetical protein